MTKGSKNKYVHMGIVKIGSTKVLSLEAAFKFCSDNITLATHKCSAHSLDICLFNQSIEKVVFQLSPPCFSGDEWEVQLCEMCGQFRRTGALLENHTTQVGTADLRTAAKARQLQNLREALRGFPVAP